MALRLIGCDWGSIVKTEADPDLCYEQAVQRVQLYDNGTPLPLMQFCAKHLAVINGESIPREEKTDAQDS